MASVFDGPTNDIGNVRRESRFTDLVGGRNKCKKKGKRANRKNELGPELTSIRDAHNKRRGLV